MTSYRHLRPPASQATMKKQIHDHETRCRLSILPKYSSSLACETRTVCTWACECLRVNAGGSVVHAFKGAFPRGALRRLFRAHWAASSSARTWKKTVSSFVRENSWRVAHSANRISAFVTVSGIQMPSCNQSTLASVTRICSWRRKVCMTRHSICSIAKKARLEKVVVSRPLCFGRIEAVKTACAASSSYAIARAAGLATNWCDCNNPAAATKPPLIMYSGHSLTTSSRFSPTFPCHSARSWARNCCMCGNVLPVMERRIIS